MVKVGWRSKAIYLLFALALVVGLSGALVPTETAMAQGLQIDSFTADPEFCQTPLEVDFTTVVSGGTAPYMYEYTWNFEYKQNFDDIYASGAAAEHAKLFGGELLTEQLAGSVETYVFTIPGYYTVQVEVTDSAATPAVITDTIEIRTLGIIPEDIAFDVKNSCHKVCVKGVSPDATQIIWNLEKGYMLDPEDIYDCAEGVLPGTKFIDSIPNLDPLQKCIYIRATTPGDIHVWATIVGDPCGVGGIGNVSLHTEKKWGELDHSVLDLDAEQEGLQDHNKLELFAPDETSVVPEVLEDTIYATFLEVDDPQTVGHAYVHWWLFQDTGENQALIDDLMDHLVAHGGAFDDDYWGVHGKYDTAVLGEMMNAPGTDKQPYDVIEYWASDPSQLRRADPNTFWFQNYQLGKEWYTWSETADSWPAEDRGTAQATLMTDTNELEQCVPEKVMIVVLVSYPGGDSPQDDYYNSENIVILERGEKEFHKAKKPKISMVKTPQVRWAGEKIVLEQDWTDAIRDDKRYNYWVLYTLDEASCGVLVNGTNNNAEYMDSRTVLVEVDTENPTSEVMLETEFQCKADVEAALYETMGGDPLAGDVLINIGFPVFFLAFEDVVLTEEDYVLDAAEITPEESFTNLTLKDDPLLPDGEDANIAIQVKGWFTSEKLGPALDPVTEEIRAHKIVDMDKDGTPDRVLPDGRWVLPDDWQRLAGGPGAYPEFPNWDLMDRAHEDDITTPVGGGDPLGPYEGVVTTDDLEDGAEYPCIGPFNTLQKWTQEDMWWAAAEVPADFDVAPAYVLPRDDDDPDLRNTVVPDGAIDWYDCPMPQALVVFNVESRVFHSATPELFGLAKTALEGYGYTGTAAPYIYHSPFYEVEIPSSELIPAIGYNYDSWDTDGPYPYWEDLLINSIISDTDEDAVTGDQDDVEVYCDNHGIAGVGIEVPREPGSVTITATAVLPQALKRQYPPMTSDKIKADWGVLDLNPHFLASSTEVEAEDVITFTNLTSGGNLPYTKAEWDFNSDGIIDVIYDGTPEAPKDPVQWSYIDWGPGVYSVKLWMTDNADVTRFEERPFYITVGGAVPTVTFEMPYGLDEDQAAVNQWRYDEDAVAVTLAEAYVEDSIPDDVSVIWHYAGTTEGWQWFTPGWPESDLMTMDPGLYYIGIATTATEWDIPQEEPIP